MDTEWFAVDGDGHVAVFDSGEDGVVPQRYLLQVGVFEDEDETEEYDLGADSFLSHVGRSLSSTMLGWHYRSHYEALIGFSNSRFYNGNLMTIPDLRGELGARESIIVELTLGRRLLNELLTTFLPTILICVVSFCTNYFRYFL